MPDYGYSKDALRAIIGLSGEFVGTTDTQTETNKTINTSDNTITATSQAAGDLLVNNGTKFVRQAIGTAGQAYKVNAGATSGEWGTLPVAGGGTGATTLTGVVIGTGTTAMTVKTNPAGAFIDDSSVQNISGAKTYANTTLKKRNPANTFTLTEVHPTILADSDYYGNLGFTYYVFKVGSSYFVSNGALGNATHTAATSSSARTTIQWAIDNVPADGGLIVLAPNTTFDLGSAVADGLTITQSATKRVDLLGCGHTTKLQYTGTGYALVINGTSSDSQSFNIGNFLIDGSAKTSGRSGILDQSIGPMGMFHDLHLRNLDEAFRIINSNSRFIERLRVKTCNIGLITAQGTTTAPNVIVLDKFNISNCSTIGIHLGTPYAGPTESSPISNSIRNGNIDACAIALQISGLAVQITVEDVYFETSTSQDIYIKGVVGFPSYQIVLKNIRASGLGGTLTNMIKIDYATKLYLENVHAVTYSNAMILFNTDTSQELEIHNPKLESTPYLIDSIALTTAGTRLKGIVVEPSRIGVISLLNQASMIEGDVVVIGSNNRYIKAAIADNYVPAVVMYGNGITADRPGVLCMKGITKVNVDAAATWGDTLTTSATSGKAKINNSAVDPKHVIGYVVESSVGAGLVYAKIL